jgi:hypothetical protein
MGVRVNDGRIEATMKTLPKRGKKWYEGRGVEEGPRAIWNNKLKKRPRSSFRPQRVLRFEMRDARYGTYRLLSRISYPESRI